MTQAIILIIVGIAGVLIGRYFAVRMKKRRAHGAAARRASMRDQNMEKLRQHLANEECQALLIC